MNKVYDNGCILLGKKYDIVQYSKKQLNKIGIDKDNKEMLEEMLREIEEFDNNTILAINYDFGMGLSIDYWEDTDKVYEDYNW